MKTPEERGAPTADTETDRRPLFEHADDVDPGDLLATWLPETFAEELIDEHDTFWDLDDFRVVECNNARSEGGLELLLVARDGTRVFVGEDATARDSNGLFGYVIGPDDRLPLVRTAREALDLLKPAQASAAEMEGATPLRQGEWFLVPTDEEPVSPVYSGGVSRRPFGGSPLENHVPTEWGIGVPEDEFMAWFERECPELADHVETPAEAFQRIWRGHEIASIEDVELLTDLPDAEALREFAEPIYVRGTLRHRDNDHYMESIGDGWRLAVTHDVDVFTMDTSDMTSPVRLD